MIRGRIPSWRLVINGDRFSSSVVRQQPPGLTTGSASPPTSSVTVDHTRGDTMRIPLRHLPGWLVLVAFVIVPACLLSWDLIVSVIT